MSRTTCFFALFFPIVFATGCGGTAENDGSGGAAGAGTGGAGAIAGSGASGGSTGGSAGSGGIGGSSGLGGASGSSGIGGGSAGAPTVGPECTDASQCTLFSDCCTCVALAPNEPSPKPCPAACIQDTCSALGVSAQTVACTAGRCVAGIACDAQVVCAIAPPDCEPGMIPSTSGGCWGPCVPATECGGVLDCSFCTGADQTCVTLDLQGGDSSSRHCVDVPDACKTNPTCECMAQNVCTPPFSACVDFSGIKGMSCSCPNC